ncbi:MAG: alpha-L-arabinofuranosidase C-terminal domain-containing protein, partial [Flavitalea sp.]
LPILNAGISCQFGSGEVVAMNEMQPVIQDALDLVEFANGDSTTIWGRKRISFGHAQPFHLKMIGIGNENFGPQYIERYKLFEKALKAAYPQISLVFCCIYSSREDNMKYVDSLMKETRIDIIDEHYYKSPAWFLKNSGLYDTYDRKLPKVFIGEYSALTSTMGSEENKNDIETAVAEAAFMTGLERNADVVTMASYAPLFSHMTDWQWKPNLIWFDNGKSFATPNYYVQQLFSLNKGTKLISITLNDQAICGQDSIWASAVIDGQTNELIVKLVNPAGSSRNKTIYIQGLKKSNGLAELITLKGATPGDSNSVEYPKAIIPSNGKAIVKNKKLFLKIAPYSVNVLKVPLQK